jgi:hypothetical protein
MATEEELREQRKEALRLLLTDFEAWSAHCGKILTKSGKTVPLQWNRAQRHIHEQLEKQKAERGYVRALILKGRQQGCSTYVAARFYHQTSSRKGRNAFIVSHEEMSTTNLFKMVKRYHDYNAVAPDTQYSNAKELIFAGMDSGYKLATAGAGKDVGRSNTVQLFHGSEFGFWQDASGLLAGIGNTVPSGAEAGGTEMILESTANGMGNAFHMMWLAAERGEGEYIPIFVPWFWQDEYRTPVRENLELSDEDREYQATYELTLEQMQWRADKIASYEAGFEWLFDQEYPATPALAFRVPTGKPLIGPNKVLAAVNSTYADMQGEPLVIGVDPAGDGEDPSATRDRTAIAFRRGRVCFRIEYHDNLDAMQLVGKLAEYDKEFRPDAIFIDKGGLGAGIYSRLRELNMQHVHGIMFGQRATDDKLYFNKRAEMWWALKDWLEDQPCRLPNNPTLISELTSPQPIWRSDSKKQLESKKDMAKPPRCLRSPDGGDALALTFAAPVTRREDHDHDADSGAHAPATTAGY